MGAIKPRTSQLDPDVPISVYPAPDVLKVGFLYLSALRYFRNHSDIVKSTYGEVI
ncbi:hypothetical protein NIES2109_63110 (plasmid) [Nostoc sp. HK-01]|nr:hypothetical protein NIES2109_63110 [Nostoc sp. HK-01]